MSAITQMLLLRLEGFSTRDGCSNVGHHGAYTRYIRPPTIAAVYIPKTSLFPIAKYLIKIDIYLNITPERTRQLPFHY